MVTQVVSPACSLEGGPLHLLFYSTEAELSAKEKVTRSSVGVCCHQDATQR